MTLSNAKPGDFTTRCITVTYSGSLAANVRIYAAVSGAMGSYVDLTVTRGTNSSAFPSCTNFTADSTNYIGAGTGVIYSGTLASFPTSGGAGNEPTSGSPATWNNGDPHSYKFTATFQSSAPAAAQGSTATADFTWEATNQ